MSTYRHLADLVPALLVAASPQNGHQSLSAGGLQSGRHFHQHSPQFMMSVPEMRLGYYLTDCSHSTHVRICAVLNTGCSAMLSAGPIWHTPGKLPSIHFCTKGSSWKPSGRCTLHLATVCALSHLLLPKSTCACKDWTC